MSAKTAKAYNEIIRKVNRAAPELFREELRKALRADPTGRLHKYADEIGRLKHEKRDIGLAVASSGIKARMSNKTLSIRVIVTKSFGGAGMYWSLLIAKGGRKEIRTERGNPMPIVLDEMPTSPSYINRKPRVDPLNPGKFLIFTQKVRAIAPYHDWQGIAFKGIRKEVISLIKDLQ
jgi:hypothetical protein